MDRNFKFNIISEGQKFGVSSTCKKHKISRTLYYIWLKRYKDLGIKGLDNVKKNFTPVNKTKPEVVSTILNLIKKQPNCGPREIKYRLEEIGYNISESAVYNVMKRYNLTTRTKRIKFSNKKEKLIIKNYPDFDNFKNGECWLFWTTSYGNFENIGTIYEYTIFDYKSKIACTRLYNQLSLENFEDILTSVAIPIAQNLNFEAKHWCFFQDYKITEKQKDSFFSHLYTIAQNSGFDINIHLLKEGDDLTRTKELRKDYTNHCLSFLMPFIHKMISFNELKTHLQKYIRDYNINNKLSYDGDSYSPVEFHVKSTNTEMILPLWAYIERRY